jgi:ribonucleoside-diphosphate reductase alpha chain
MTSLTQAPFADAADNAAKSINMNTINNPKDPMHLLAPGQLRVIKRDSTLAAYDESKIANAITQAFNNLEEGYARDADTVREIVNRITQQVTAKFQRSWPSGGSIHIEDIQERVEYALMKAEEYQVFRHYVLYRDKRRQEREEAASKDNQATHTLNIKQEDGSLKPLNEAWLRAQVDEACKGLADVNADLIVKYTLRNLFDGATLSDVYKTTTLSARAHNEREPNYGFTAARLLLNDLRQEVLTFLGFSAQWSQAELNKNYSDVFTAYIERGIELGTLDPKLKTFNLEKLGSAIKGERDTQFTYLGLQTLYDRYFLHSKGIHYELPQTFFMRVAMGLAIAETKNQTQHAIEFYNLLSSFDYMASTPTLFNAGTMRPQLSSCFLTTIPDDLEGIYGAIRDNALLSKFAGGIGNDWTPVRGIGAHIRGTNGKSQGVVPFMNVADATAIAVNQGGKRKGAVCGYLEAWHMDFEEFLELRKNTGDDRRRTHDMNTAAWVPDLLMKRVFEDKAWTLFSPEEVPNLHDSYGLDFEKLYITYEEKAARGEIRGKTISALSLWRKMLSMLYETGHPWLTFKDACNLRSPQQHAGVIHSSNLCTEITLNTNKDEIAVCNLGSINLANHVNEKGLDQAKLAQTIKTAVRMLDNVIDINYYTVPQARRSNLQHRPVGLGIMGFQDALYLQRIPYSSNEAVDFADRSMEAISYYAISSSCDLAEERGTYASYEGSLWSKGILPIDSIALLQEARGQYLEQDTSSTLDWKKLRTRVATTGMRNSNIMAIAPTATISNICGVSQSIEPTYQNLFVKSNMSGEFTVPYLVRDLKALNLWDDLMINDLKYYDGSLKPIKRIPEELKKLYATAFEIEPRWLVDAGSRRQKWIDQAQSLNLYMAEPSGKRLDVLYRMAWLRGLKTTYYLRSLGATNAEKSTITDGALNAVKMTEAPKACSIEDPDCEACQ